MLLFAVTFSVAIRGAWPGGLAGPRWCERAAGSERCERGRDERRMGVLMAHIRRVAPLPSTLLLLALSHLQLPTPSAGPDSAIESSKEAPRPPSQADSTARALSLASAPSHTSCLPAPEARSHCPSSTRRPSSLIRVGGHDAFAQAPAGYRTRLHDTRRARLQSPLRAGRPKHVGSSAPPSALLAPSRRPTRGSSFPRPALTRAVATTPSIREKHIRENNQKRPCDPVRIGRARQGEGNKEGILSQPRGIVWGLPSHRIASNRIEDAGCRRGRRLRPVSALDLDHYPSPNPCGHLHVYKFRFTPATRHVHNEHGHIASRDARQAPALGGPQAHHRRIRLWRRTLRRARQPPAGIWGRRATGRRGPWRAAAREGTARCRGGAAGGG